MFLLNTLYILIASLVGAICLLWAQAYLLGPARGRPDSDDANKKENTEELDFMAHYRFWDNDLIHEDGVSAVELIGAKSDKSPGLEEMIQHLSRRFGALESRVERLPETGPFALKSTDQKLELSVSMSGLETDLTLSRCPNQRADPNTCNDEIESEFADAEMVLLRSVVEQIPFLVWRVSGDGQITWANEAYLDLARELDDTGDVQSYPVTQLFKTPESTSDGDTEIPARIRLKSEGPTPERWFDVQQKSVGKETLFFATRSDAIVQAEDALKGFVQTLTKTFAHLDTGLAIFDRDRNLTMFNPALAEMTGLRSEFLAKRPGLLAFLDRLRDRRMLPEPKDYKSWRQQMLELETQASEGTYCEQWPLADGRMFQVTGRPYPDGAVAFMIRDVSEEVHNERTHREQLDAYECAMNSLTNAVAVFDRSGTLLLANAAYRELWQDMRSGDPSPVTLNDATKAWSKACAPSPIWGDIRAFSGDLAERAEWVGHARLRSGQALVCRVVPSSHGATIISFEQDTNLDQIAYADYGAVISPLGVQSETYLNHG